MFRQAFRPVAASFPIAGSAYTFVSGRKNVACSDFDDRAHVWDGKTVHSSMLIEGGGTKGVAYGPVVTALEKAGLMSSINKFAGTSAGSQTAALLAFGYTGEELDRILKKAPWKNLLDGAGGFGGFFRDIYRLWRHFGFYKGDVLQHFLDDEFEKKSGKKLTTFTEHFELTGNELRLGACCISTGTFVFLDRHNTPDMPVAIAARASSSVPLVFRAVEWKGKLYVDGGVMGNLPIHAFPGERALGFELVGKTEWAERHAEGHLKEPTHVFQVFSIILEMLMQAAQAGNGFAGSGNDGIEVIKILIPDGTSMLETNVEGPYADGLAAAGREAIERYLGGKSVAK